MLHCSTIIFNKDEFKLGLNCLSESGPVHKYFQHPYLKFNSPVPSETIKHETYTPILVVYLTDC